MHLLEGSIGALVYFSTLVDGAAEYCMFLDRPVNGVTKAPMAELLVDS